MNMKLVWIGGLVFFWFMVHKDRLAALVKGGA